jgi:hypothetical protein
VKTETAMLLGPIQTTSDPWTTADVRGLRAFAPQPRQTPRGRHAHLLDIAAARRRRSIERAGLGRTEDAGYWKAVAPTAVFKAAELRADNDFATLPN